VIGRWNLGARMRRRAVYRAVLVAPLSGFEGGVTPTVVKVLDRQLARQGCRRRSQHRQPHKAPHLQVPYRRFWRLDGGGSDLALGDLLLRLVLVLAFLSSLFSPVTRLSFGLGEACHLVPCATVFRFQDFHTTMLIELLVLFPPCIIFLHFL